MQTALRKMGNSTGLVLSKPMLKALGLATGSAMDVVIRNGRVIATPIRRKIREGWEEDAQRIGAAPLTAEERDWAAFGNVGDDAIEW
jgi:antitoxin MazE